MKDRSFLVISSFVIFTHVGLALYLLVSVNSPPPQPLRRLIVQNISLRPQEESKDREIALSSRPPSVQLEQKRNEKPQKQKSVQRYKEKPIEKIPKKELLAKAQESLAKVGSSRNKNSTSKGGQEVSLVCLKWETDSLEGIGSLEGDYRDEIACRIKETLRLPEYGEVCIRLTLARSGSVVKVEILETKSEKNSQYVVQALLHTKFPPLGKRIESEYYSCTISLRSD